MPVLPDDITLTELMATVVVNNMETIRRRLEELPLSQKPRALKLYDRMIQNLEERGHVEGACRRRPSGGPGESAFDESKGR